LTISNGASVGAAATTLLPAVVLGEAAGGNGILTVTGAGSLATLVGQVDVGQSGTGSLTIANAGTVFTGDSAKVPTPGIDIAQYTGGAGSITVSGTAARLGNTGEFVVGDAGVGSLTVAAGGVVDTTPGSVAGLAGLSIANTAGASGSSVNVSGGASRLDIIGGTLDVGSGGSGTLQISGGATVTAAALDAGTVAGSVGQIALSGRATDLAVTGAATVADAGTAVLSVLSGATFAAGSLTIGAQRTGSGTVTLSGAGSGLQLAGALNVGTALGAGALTVGSGAAVHAAVVDLQGQLTLQGGLLDPTVLLINPGITPSGFGTIGANFVIDEGTILARGSIANQNTLLVLGSVLGGGTLTVSGNPSIVGTTTNSPGLLQIGSGDQLEVTGAVLNAPSTTFSDTQGGTYLVNNSVVDVVFQDATGVLALDDISGFGGTIASWHPGDALVIATTGSLSALGVSNGNTLTVHDSGTGGIDQIVFGSSIKPASLAITNGNTIVGGATIVSGSTLEIAGGPFGLTNFDGAGQPQYTTLLIDPGVSVATDASDLLSGVTLINQGTLNLGTFVATAPLQNSGELTGDVTLASGVTLTNAAGGTIVGSGLAAIQATLGPATVSNAGMIDPATDGVDLTAGGSVSNAAGASIEGTQAGVAISGGAGTVTNAGLIRGGGVDAVTLAA
ncbi:MAG: hypothetical protein P4L86_25735, partial [Mycobacterium sp.]|nr:hypothetical protein [Mycobacterium sp.]